MRTDPREACGNESERFLWAIVHDLLAHPFMAITLYSQLSLRFHDFTSRRAWPRVVPEVNGTVFIWSSRFGSLEVKRCSEGFYQVSHPTVAHKMVTNASDCVEAAEKAEKWFTILAEEFGGKFLAFNARKGKDNA